MTKVVTVLAHLMMVWPYQNASIAYVYTDTQLCEVTRVSVYTVDSSRRKLQC
jgi:hypothetical protein